MYPHQNNADGKMNDADGNIDKFLLFLSRLSECQIGPAGAPESMLPLNIGQEFKTLYDQHYTMALDELEDKHGTLNVKETVKMFLNILKASSFGPCNRNSFCH